MIREKVKELWKLCFDDTEEYINLYFQSRYNNDVNIAIQSGEEVIAALQMLPYPMTYEGTEIQTSYVSGACTHPDYRSKGVMRELLSQAFTRMHQQGIHLSTLIPAEPWLFGYYAQRGYAAVFNYGERTFTPRPKAQPEYALKLEVTQAYKEEDYAYLHRKLKERPNCVQHTKEDYQTILCDLQIGKGKVYTLIDEETIVALTIAHPTPNGGLLLDDVFYDSRTMSTCLLQLICEENHLPSITLRFSPTEEDAGNLLPLGMARIINAQAMLQLYANNHPELEANLYVSDNQISANSGYYYLDKGKCRYSAKRLPGSHSTLTIGELTEKIFESLNPYMSLMLNA